jgi:hypothetical protein
LPSCYGLSVAAVVWVAVALDHPPSTKLVAERRERPPPETIEHFP